jgi:hypothetical protein
VLLNVTLKARENFKEGWWGGGIPARTFFPISVLIAIKRGDTIGVEGEWSHHTFKL